MKISETLKKIGLNEDDQKKLETAIKDLITEKVELKRSEIQKDFDDKFENAVNEEVEKQVTEHKEKLEEAAETWKKDFAEDTTNKLDLFLEQEIVNNISDKALEKIAINETLEPVVENIRKVFSENSITLDSEGDVLLKKYKKENEELKEKTSTLIKEKMELNET